MLPHFRPATPADLDDLLAMSREFHGFFREPPHPETVARQALSGIITDPSLGRVWLIHLGG